MAPGELETLLGCRSRGAACRSAPGSSTGLMSMTGVWSSASSPLTRIRRPSMARIWARYRPIGLGRSGERVPNTPSGGLAGLSPGTLLTSSRRERSSQVSKMTCWPARRSRTAAAAWSHGPVGAVVADWPAVSLVGSYELLAWLIRTSGTVECAPSVDPSCNGVACGVAVHAASTAAVDGELSSRSWCNASDQTREPGGPVGGQPASHTDGQCHDAVPEAGAVNDAAVAAYRLSVRAGNPLSERKLAPMFGRTSRRWARARIAEARQVRSPGLAGNQAPVMSP